METLRNALNADCVSNREWRQCAEEILQLNNMDDSKFKNAIVELLEKGCGEGRNILITGPANCGKTFILDPLRVIYKSFVNPATCTYALMGVDSFLQASYQGLSIIPLANFEFLKLDELQQSNILSIFDIRIAVPMAWPGKPCRAT